ncbi:MAG: lamin tail domain-containing protein, partial [Myxococcales bacterium]|nr:lamin tail domain-containing protein [Myxococcales bacterium]
LTDIGSCTLGVESCVDGAWGACAGSVGPEPERCDGVLDENCDGSVDEGCECIAGATEPCGSDIGACVPGMRTCGADGRWGACEGMTLPSSESCNGIDDDCDGITDEALSRACGSEIGACVAGTQTCSIGTWGGCIGEIGPGPETCDGSLDEDCDGEIDEGCECTIDATRPCGSDIGACSPGLDTCGLDGTWGGCVGAISPTRETCNGLDDDCDGSLDEGLSRACGSDTGECVAGVQTCSVGVWGGCAGEIGPAPEICDGLLDQDCDGTVDEGCGCTAGETRPCGSATGTCVQGAQTCAIDGTWGACTGEIGPGVEVCDGALDEDCDGIVDEGCACVSGQTRACGSTTGACDAGTETCDLSGSWGTCTGAVGPGVEVCNGIDDDCDGSTDEGLNRTCGATDLGVCQFGSQSCSAGSWGFCTGNVDPGLERCDGTLDENCNGTVDEGCACISGQTRACGNGVGECQQGLETCDLSGSWGACIGGSGPTPESCNGLDDDCDGSIDEALSRSCGSAAGACMPGLETCSAGAWGVCTGGVGPEPELCDGAIDEDCDGSIDEGCLCTAGQTQPCGTNMGECVAGLRTCDLMGAFGACVGEILPGVESCNGLDDDCDGAIDEGVCFPPNVTCPMDQTTDLGLSVTLGASGADPDGGALSYAWTIVTAPAGSSALPASPTSASTSFTPDVAGDTTLRFCATDDEGAQSCCTVLVRAMNTCSLPATPTLTACGISWDRRPLVEFDPLPAGVTYELFKDADALPYATVTLEGQNYHRPLAELGLGGPPPGVDTSIYLRACVSADPTCCATSLPVDISLVESCTTPIAPAPENTIFSEYAINGDGPCPGADCEAGEAIEIVNLSHCPVSLDNHHFSYCNGSCGAFRWMNFGPAEIIPPRGVYVAIRNHAASTCSYPFFGPDDPGLYGLKISTLAMESGGSLASGWFVNSTGSGLSKLRIASGPWVDIASGTTIDQIAPYLTSAGECSSIGFDAYDACGNIGATASPGTTLTPNQLGRLWHPCDAVTAPVPALCE